MSWSETFCSAKNVPNNWISQAYLQTWKTTVPSEINTMMPCDDNYSLQLLFISQAEEYRLQTASLRPYIATRRHQGWDRPTRPHPQCRLGEFRVNRSSFCFCSMKDSTSYSTCLQSFALSDLTWWHWIHRCTYNWCQKANIRAQPRQWSSVPPTL